MAGGLAVDSTGRLYVATNLGVQVCDPAGRPNCILPTPTGRPTQLCFGGEEFDTLFVTCGDTVYRCKLKVDGVPGHATPIKPGEAEDFKDPSSLRPRLLLQNQSQR